MFPNPSECTILGGNPGSAEKAAAELKGNFPDLEIAGCHCPDFGFENDVETISEIAEFLAAAKPDIVFVGLGSPKQDVLINMLRLQMPHVWWLGVGISFSFVAGEIIRAPEWAKRTGLNGSIACSRNRNDWLNDTCFKVFRFSP